MPKVSVIMPAYNAEKYIAEAIDSILGQTFTDLEFIILNDCSADSTEKIILSYADDRIVYIKNEKNMGVAATLNRGIAIATGEYIARMDADDISLPERFEKQVAFLDSHPDVAVLGSAVDMFGAQNQVVRYSESDGRLKVDLLFGSCFAHPSVMMRTEVIRSLGGYDRAYEGMEDYALWCRVAKNHQLATIQQVLLRYRIHPGQVTQKRFDPNKALRYYNLQAELFSDLGVCTEGAGFDAWCRISTGEPDVLQACADFLRQVMEMNREKKMYDPDYLASSAKGALLRYIDRLPLKQAFTTAQRCGISPVYYGLRRLRQFLHR